MNRILSVLAFLSVSAAAGSYLIFNSDYVVQLVSSNNAPTQPPTYAQAKAELVKTLTSSNLDPKIKQDLQAFAQDIEQALQSVQADNNKLSDTQTEQALQQLEESLKAQYAKAGLDYDAAYLQAEKQITKKPTDPEIQKMLQEAQQGESHAKY